MRIIHGKEVFETLEEIADARHAALIIVDVQNDFCSPQGLRGGPGKDLSMMAEMIANLKLLLEEARRQDVLRVFIQFTNLPNAASDSGAWLYRNLTKDMRADAYDDFCLDGSWGHEVVAELEPLPGEIRVKKHRSSAFFGTSLDVLLRNSGIKTCVVTGTATSGCVDATVRDAQYHDYYTVVPRDCCAQESRAHHEASLLISKADICTSNDLIPIWSTARQPAMRNHAAEPRD